MDEVITRENLPGNSARAPKKKVTIMVVAAFEDCGNPQEKIFYWSPVHVGDLPKFRLCNDLYWRESASLKDNKFTMQIEERPDALRLRDAIGELNILAK